MQVTALTCQAFESLNKPIEATAMLEWNGIVQYVTGWILLPFNLSLTIYCASVIFSAIFAIGLPLTLLALLTAISVTSIYCNCVAHNIIKTTYFYFYVVDFKHISK